MPAPVVSVVVPVYNVAAYLEASVRSLLAQTLKDIEVILVDDGSTDGSGDIVDRLADGDCRVKAVHRTNSGAGVARNAGLALATGTYLFFSDPDDLVRSDYFDRLVARAEATRADVVASDHLEYDLATGRFSVERIGRRKFPRLPFAAREAIGLGARLFHGLTPMVWNKLFRREFILSCGIVFQDVRKFNDMCFAFEAICRAGRIAILDDFGYLYFSRRPKSLQNTKTLSSEMIRSVYDEFRRRLVVAGIYDVFEKPYAELRERDLRQWIPDAEDRPAKRKGLRKLAHDFKTWRREAWAGMTLRLKWPEAVAAARRLRETANRLV